MFETCVLQVNLCAGTLSSQDYSQFQGSNLPGSEYKTSTSFRKVHKDFPFLQISAFTWIDVFYHTVAHLTPRLIQIFHPRCNRVNDDFRITMFRQPTKGLWTLPIQILDFFWLVFPKRLVWNGWSQEDRLGIRRGILKILAIHKMILPKMAWKWQVEIWIQEEWKFKSWKTTNAAAWEL